MKLSRHELSVRKSRLEQDIVSQVSRLVGDFKSDTGFPINYINISFEEVTEIGKYPDYVIAKADVDICI